MQNALRFAEDGLTPRLLQGLPIESVTWGLDKATGDFKVRDAACTCKQLLACSDAA